MEIDGLLSILNKTDVVLISLCKILIIYHPSIYHHNTKACIVKITFLFHSIILNFLKKKIKSN